jgi:hypothetical protein
MTLAPSSTVTIVSTPYHHHQHHHHLDGAADIGSFASSLGELEGVPLGAMVDSLVAESSAAMDQHEHLNPLVLEIARPLPGKNCACGHHRPSFGLRGSPCREALWCATCPTKPPEAVNVKNRRCECGQSEPSFGLPDEDRKRARWCSKCPTKHPQAVNVKKKQAAHAAALRNTASVATL